MIFRIERQRFIFATQLLEETEKKEGKNQIQENTTEVQRKQM